MPELIEQIVTKPEELPDALAHLAAVRRFGFDTEFVGEETYRPRLCLVQVATDDRIILIDPFTVGPLDEFWKLILDPENEVVAHAAREEIRLCQLWTGKRPERVFDLQIAAGLVGLPFPLGHGNLVRELLGVTLAKTETLTEWRDRPLTDRQIRYAFDDVRYLLRLQAEISKRLSKLQRSNWALEEFRRAARIATEEEATLERWRKLRGVGALSRRQLAVVRELFGWREEAAARLNRPARTILRDDLLIEIARRDPHRDRDLEVVRGLAKRDIRPILDAVERARSLSPLQLPTAPERDDDPPQVALLTNLLSAVLGHLCSEMELATSLVCATRDLKLLVRSYLEGSPEGIVSLLNEGWRRDHVRPHLDAVLRGERVIRVRRLDRQNPLELLGPGQNPQG
jgi:ribonuclease D